MTQTITGCWAREILDSRGLPTIEVTIRSNILTTSAAVPSGKSTGTREAKELRDPDGIGVKVALEKIERKVAPNLLGLPLDASKIDSFLISMDDSANKSNLGGNVMIGVSFAAWRLEALSLGIPLWKHIAEKTGRHSTLPRLFMNMINGGVHADFRLPFQEYIVVLDGSTPRSAFERGSEIFYRLDSLIKSEFGQVPMGDEGGFSPELSSLEKPFELLLEAIGNDGEDVFLAIDAAASELFSDGVYQVGNQTMTAVQLSNIYSDFVKRFSLKSIEDPFAEDDLSSFANLLRREGDNILVVGDDLTVTNPTLITLAQNRRAINAVIIKPNQIGTVSEALEAARLAREAGWKIIVSHRSGETEDSFVSDLAVGIGAFGIKAGSPRAPIRRKKYERLIEIFEKEFNLI